VSITLALQHHVPAAARRGARRWLYAGDDPSFDLPGLERVVTSDVSMAAARDLREPYLDAIGALSRLNASPEWWASYLAAKQPYPSLFARLCGLEAARRLATDGTLVVCSTPAQLEELRLTLEGTRAAGTALGRLRRHGASTALRVVWPVLRTFGARAPEAWRGMAAGVGPRARFAIQRAPGHRRRTLEALGARPLPPFGGADTALLITWIDQRCFGPAGEYRDPHLGPLGTMLRARGLRVARVVKPLLHAPLADCAHAMSASREPAAFSDLYVSGADWRSCERRVNHAVPTIPSELRVGEVPFARLAREYVGEHRRAQAEALSHEAMVRNLARTGVRPELIILPWEGHPWEQVLTDAVRHHMAGTKLVAYDNLNFSSLALSLYPSPAEIGIRPLPDRVVTNGPTFAAVLRGSGFPSERVRVGCALRHAGLTDRRPETHGAGSFVLAAGSIDAAQSIELLGKASSAFGDELVARLHPASDARAIRAALPSGVRYADQPLTELLQQARLMLYSYSAVAYEALAAGVPPVFVRSESMLDLDQLEPTPDVRWVARTPRELRAVALTIASMPERAAWERRAREVVTAALAPVGPGCVEPFLCRDS
jgi:hypothetical protein